MRECKKYQEELSEYLAGELSGVSKEKLEQHLVTCPSCQAELQELKVTFDILEQEKKTAPALAEADFLASVLFKIEQKQPSLASSGFRLRWVGFGLAGVLVILLAWSLFQVDLSRLAKKGSADTQTQAYDEFGQTGQDESDLTEAELTQLLTPETDQNLDQLYIQLEKDYYQKEDLATVLADLSQSDFKILETKMKNVNLEIK